jgi:hypothetical protein
MKLLNKIGFVAFLWVSISFLSSCGSSNGYTDEVQYTNPSWAPDYYSGVRYYYMPDMEVYYDLSNQDFVYLENGQWLFTHYLPPFYSSYDLDNCFVIALNTGVYQPWMHHHFYISHYPRYYYRNIYREDERPKIRGFNENGGRPIYHRNEVRPRINQPGHNEKPERKPQLSREPQNTNYYGKEIGRPVKVKPAMKETRKPVEKASRPEIIKERPKENKAEINKQFNREEKNNNRREIRPR